MNRRERDTAIHQVNGKVPDSPRWRERCAQVKRLAKSGEFTAEQIARKTFVSRDLDVDGMVFQTWLSVVKELSIDELFPDESPQKP